MALPTRHGLALQTMNALILTIITISIVTIILTKITNPQPIKDVGNFYDSIMNPEDTTPPNQDILEYKEGHLILHTEYLPARTTLRITLQDLKDRTFLQREYSKTNKPIILPEIAPPITHIILDITTPKQTTQHHYYLLQEHFTRETIHQASQDILTLIQKDKDLAHLFTTCTITPPTGREITLAEVIQRSISPTVSLCKPTYRMGGENSPWYAFTHCQTGDCSGFIIQGVCPDDGKPREEERLALFIGNLQNILLGHGIDLLGMERIILSREGSEALREEILAHSREKYLPLECEAHLFSPDES